ncbi:cysteine desulfurase [Virgibacillus natechei]|uniref:Cysteine desulfurase n=1 Tax=Virgibacillus natechei TaxID=1216297 RepID=A0ABS4IFH2_9BACI|nr:IscS subfamily cysteine desulfurase [Virgibacillus natechei]MBP1969221.1 cysteine desulfurase [Virgibacillus natechei]UZD12384.1 IscS subfamily cysteine desulfurase [Virgibacillus natechei]
MIYLDYAATTPISDEALDVYTKVSKSFFGNANSLHDAGSDAFQLLETCREELANLLHGAKEGIYFTSGGSEANSLALSSLIDAHKEKGNHLITTATEHSSVDHFFKKMEGEGFDVTYLPVDDSGRLAVDDVEDAIRETTILASIHHANGEIGTVQPIEAIGNLLQENNILFHADCVQTFGKIPIDLRQFKLDSLSLSSHKIYGPKGVGAAYIDPKVKWQPQIPHTTHESGFRPGTVNVPGIAAFVTSAKAVCDAIMKEGERITELRAKLMASLPSMITVEGDETHFLPHILGLRIANVEGQYTMLECNRHGVAISTGSACQVGKQEPSRTIKALGRTDAEAKQFIRLSFGKQVTMEDIDQTAAVFREVLGAYFGEGVRV